ncbi:hypothetical protein HY546_00290 [archaeon]|nr:hypothetical protein [archaeon]
MFAVILIGCTVGGLWYGFKAYRARNVQAVTVPAVAVPVSVGIGFTFLGVLAALGLKWADDKRKRQERK